MKFEVLVCLKPEVLDPEGRAIGDSLKSLGIKNLKSISISKKFLIEISENEKNPDKLVEDIAKNHLANSVSEIYTVKRIDI